MGTVHRPVVWLAAAVAGGILLTHALRLHPAVPLFVMLGAGGALAGAALWVSRLRGGWLAYLLVFAAAFCGWRYATLRMAAPGPLGAWLDQTVAVRGIAVEVKSDPATGNWRALTVVEAVRAEGAAGRPVSETARDAVTERHGEWRPASGRLWVTYRWRPVSSGAAPVLPAEGDRIEVAGRLTLPAGPRGPGGFDLREYLARRAVFATLRSKAAPLSLGPGPPAGGLAGWFRPLRARLEGLLHQHLPPDQAALLGGLILGGREGIPAEWQEQFRISGVYHILVASGGNVLLVAGSVTYVLGWLGWERRRAALAALPAIVAYCLISGASPPVLRATLMACLLFGGLAMHRQSNGYNSLTAAALFMLLVTPAVLLDAGFQLSFLATWGILALSKPIQAWLERWVHPALAAGIAVTMAATAGVGPLMFNFGQVSLISPVANLMAGLLTALLLPLGLAGMLAGLVYPPLGGAVLGLCSYGVDGLVWSMGALAHLPWAAVATDPLPLGWSVAWYAGLVALRWPAELRQWLVQAAAWQQGAAADLARSLPRGVAVSGWAVAAALAVSLAWQGGRLLAGPAPPRTLEVHVLDVGQGDAILLRFPGGTDLLVDGGWAPEGTGQSGTDYGAAVVVPYLRQAGVGRLAAVVLSHPHQDHVGGLPAVLAAFPVGEVWDPGGDRDSPGYRRFRAAVQARQVPAVRPVAGQVVRFGDLARIEVLHPEAVPLRGTQDDENANSIVLRVVYGETAVLLTGDIEEEAEAALLANRRPLRSQVLKVAHHGSGGASTERFLAAVQPEVAVVSAGAGNPFGHPDPAALERLEQAGAEVYRTDRHGTVVVRVTPERWEVEADRNPSASRWVGAW